MKETVIIYDSTPRNCGCIANSVKTLGISSSINYHKAIPMCFRGDSLFHIIMKYLFIVPLLVSMCSCQETAIREVAAIPTPPDYSASEMWYNNSDDIAGLGADVFYIPSTWEFDWKTSDSTICHHADVWNPTHRQHMETEMSWVARNIATDCRFFSPQYRHITLDSWATLNEDTINNRFQSVAFQDIKNAFDYYLENWNHGRPFVLAGFSQGGKSVVELIKTLPDSVYQRMIAAYVMGYKVTPQDTIDSARFIAATDSVDVGVTICYNSVSDVKYIKSIVASPNVIGINPVNWRPDTTPGILNDSITVTLTTQHNVLVVQGYDGSHLMELLGILNTGDYHSADLTLYATCLEKNIKQRIRSSQK